MTPFRVAPLLGLLVLLGAAVSPPAPEPKKFDHEKHAKLFPGCEGCHAGVMDSTRPIWPEAGSCTSCHDGEVEERVEYTPRRGMDPSNFRFTHGSHALESTKKLGGDSTLVCGECHIPEGKPWMAVRKAKPEPCFACHEIRAEHTAAPDTACALCHLPLAEAVALTRERIAEFPKPDSHDEPGFITAKGHGAQAKPPAGVTWEVAPSCATCHAREFCIECHVNAPEVAAIRALPSDPRSTAIEAELEAPRSHEAGDFLLRHGGMAKREPKNCVTCHTRENCLTCHRAQPAVAVAIIPAGPGRAAGPHLERKQPVSHTASFADRHGPVASASPNACRACHARAECLDCHRPAAGGAGSYHPAGFLTRHPAAAWSRQTDCATCHNQAQFCADCHRQAGLTARGPLSPGYHDGNGFFGLNHGQAARRGLESCVACHAERDCLACHSAQSGRHFNPHGPGFDAERLRQRNPQTCAACHGRAIP